MKNPWKKTLVASICLGTLAFAPALATATEGSEPINNNQASGAATSTVQSGGNTAVSIGAEVDGGSQNVAVGSSIQIINGSGNVAENYGALVVGGSGNTAIGSNAQVVDGSSSQAVGFGSLAGRGNNNTAIGNHAYAGGLYNGPRSDENVAIGVNATAYGGGSVAIGAFSVASEPNTVSVGQPGYERRITNVAPGYYGTDAVNMNQLRDTQSRIDRLGATAMAMSALAPMGFNPKEPTQFSVGTGTYNGRAGLAFGVYHYTHESVMINAAIGWTSDGWEKAGRAGITWWAGGRKDKSKTPDNTVHVSNLPGQQNPAIQGQQPVTQQGNAGSGGIVDRVNKLLNETNI